MSRLLSFLSNRSALLSAGMLQSAGVDVLNSAEGRARASCLANLPLEMIANAYEACVTIAVEAENNS